MPNARHRPHENVLKQLGENVRVLRKRQGYTQEHLAELIEVSTRMIQKIEYGSTNILATTAMRLRVALNCDWAELMPNIELPNKLVRKSRTAAKK